MIIRSKQELDILRKGGKLLARILKDLKNFTREGVATKQLNERAMSLIFQLGAEPSFLGYQNYPAALCVSVNNEIVHCLPSNRKLKKGDIVSLDLGIWYPKNSKQKLCVDAAITFGIGKISFKAFQLIKVTKKSLEIAISKIKAGSKLGDIGFIIQRYVEKNNFNVVRELAGHGVGKAVHEEPLIPNFGKKGTGLVLKEGMVLAIEPMVTAGHWRVKLDKDGFCFKTVDNSLSAHFEHTILVKKNSSEVLTKI